MRAASLGPTPGSVVSCSAEAVLMLTLPAGAGLAAATASPVVRVRAKATARAVATMRFIMQSPFPFRVLDERRVRGSGRPSFGLAGRPALLSFIRRGPR